MRKYKKAFSMVTAIFVIFIMSSITALIMGVSSKTVKATTQQYQKEQAILLARSYTELAMLYVLNYERNATNTCIESIDASFGDPNNLYVIKTNIKYIGNDTLLTGCASNITPTWSVPNPIGFNATISLIIDVFVTYKDFDDPSDRNTTFHRRTVQKL
jgi:type II secretory pathway pseudopilin PulG